MRDSLGTVLSVLPRTRFAKAAVVLALLGGVGGAALGFGLKVDLPEIRALESYTPPLSTRVVAREGQLLASFGEQKRILLASRDVPEVFKKALVATEDSRFYEHSGVDINGIARAAWHDLKTMSLAQGASTITQQLARNLFLAPEKTARRKFQEILVALEIEKHYSKEEILTLYANQVYMGHGRYGLEAASQFFFGKHARELTLPEAALLAGIIQRPEGLSPIRSPERAVRRRNHVLQRMVDENSLAPADAERAKAEPLKLNPRPEQAELAPYFVEQVRRWLQQTYGDDNLYQRGLQVKTTLDARLQEAANAAVESGLRALDRRQGWRGRAGVVPSGQSPDAFVPDSAKGSPRKGALVEAVVVGTSPGKARLRVGDRTAVLDAEAVKWTGRVNPAAMVRRGDLVFVRLLDVPAEGPLPVELEQQPRVEAALVALDPRTGEVLALVGGFDFGRSEFDRAVQARRQAGSSFKPIVAATALNEGASPSTRLLDAPTVFVDPTTMQPYQPENYGKKYYGDITLRESIEKSANIATVRLLERTGYAPVIETARRLGITTDLRPYPSMALGAFEVSLLELTGAYAAFANEGVRIAPQLVQEVADRDRSPLFRARPEVEQAVSPQVAYQMNRLLQGVITDGTGAAAASLGRPLAGKTGTTDDFTDAWFVGYAPDLAVGVWVGFDTKKSLGSRETGAQAALPIWQAFMEQALAGRPIVDFAEPPSVVTVAVDRLTGLRASDSAGCASIVSEAFVEGTEPAIACSPAEHERLRFPWPFQSYPLGEDGALEIPVGDLERLLASEMFVRLSADGDAIEYADAAGRARLAVRTLPGANPTLPEELAGKVDASTWAGADGRAPLVVVVGSRN